MLAWSGVIAADKKNGVALAGEAQMNNNPAFSDRIFVVVPAHIRYQQAAEGGKKGREPGGEDGHTQWVTPPPLGKLQRGLSVA